jgi:hypothetical protein
MLGERGQPRAAVCGHLSDPKKLVGNTLQVHGGDANKRAR